MRRLSNERLNVGPDVIGPGHLPAPARLKELADAFEPYAVPR